MHLPSGAARHAARSRSKPGRCRFTSQLIFTAKVTTAMLLTLGFPALPLSAQSVDFTSSRLPIVIIDTDGVEIPDEPKIRAHMGIIRSAHGENHVDSAFTDYAGAISIELRGNSSLNYDQKQFLFKTLDQSEQEVNVQLMGFPAEHDWILYAPAVDKSLMRNVLMYGIARELGWYASRTHFCELLLNGDYRGVYVLLESIKRDKHRVNVSKLGADIVTGEPITGGYILAIDHNGKENDKGFPGLEDSSGYFVYWYVYPSPKNINIQQEWYIQSYVKSFETLMRHPAFNEPIRGYSAFLNVASFVDYILLNEWANNVDGYVASAYLHKDRQDAGGKLTAGPVWDFNIAFGNANFSDADRTSGWRVHHGRVPFWWRRLLQDPAFVQRLEQRWTEIRASFLHEARLEHLIDSVSTLLSEAQERHFRRWDLLGTYIWPNAYVGETYQDEVDYLKSWIRDRLAWMDEHLPTIALPLEGAGTTSIDPRALLRGPSIAVYPAPSTGSITVRCNPATGVRTDIVVRDLLGREVRRVTPGLAKGTDLALTIHLHDQPAGLYQIILLLNGAPSAFSMIQLLR
jgi:hypothetical protein